MSDEMKPCPFCGSKFEWHIGGIQKNILFYGCSGAARCSVRSVDFEGVDFSDVLRAAKRIWNRRSDDRYQKAEKEGRLVVLPVPVGAPLYVICQHPVTDGTAINEVEEFLLSGYLKEGGHEFYTTYSNGCTCDIDVGDVFTTREAAEAALAKKIADKQ